MAWSRGSLGRFPDAKSGRKGAWRGRLIHEIRGQERGNEEEEAEGLKKEVANTSKIGVIKLQLPKVGIL